MGLEKFKNSDIKYLAKQLAQCLGVNIPDSGNATTFKTVDLHIIHFTENQTITLNNVLDIEIIIELTLDDNLKINGTELIPQNYINGFKVSSPLLSVFSQLIIETESTQGTLIYTTPTP